jgi:hypothetical protein
MTKTYIKNKGTTTFISSIPGHDDNYNKINWDVDYDGNKANIEMDINSNGKSEHVDYELTNDDLAGLLNVPSFQMPLEERLINDFPLHDEDFFLPPPNNNEIFIVPAHKRKLVRHRISPLVQPLRIRKIKPRSHRVNYGNKTFSSLRKKLSTPKPKTLRIILHPKSSTRKLYLRR